jgi:hypoxanthine phosphoribosyltransferase
MAEPGADVGRDVRPLLCAEEIAGRIEALADTLVPRLTSDAVAVCLLLGGLWFAADLMRALARRGHPLAFDALWLSSYGEQRQGAGRCEVRAGLQRPVAGRQVVVLDDVADSGVSLAQAVALVREAGAGEVITAVFARKPWPDRALEPDFVAWEAPSRFLVGYGMDLAGAARGLPFVGAVD